MIDKEKLRAIRRTSIRILKEAEKDLEDVQTILDVSVDKLNENDLEAVLDLRDALDHTKLTISNLEKANE